MSTRRLVQFGLILSLLIAGVLAYYASAHPDGLEFVAERLGFLDSAQDSATSASPLAGYGVSGVGDGRLSSGLAGVLGVAAVAVIAFALFRVLGHRKES